MVVMAGVRVIQIVDCPFRKSHSGVGATIIDAMDTMVFSSLNPMPPFIYDSYPFYSPENNGI